MYFRMALNPTANIEANTPNPRISQKASVILSDPWTPTVASSDGDPRAFSKNPHSVLLKTANIFFFFLCERIEINLTSPQTK